MKGSSKLSRVVLPAWDDERTKIEFEVPRKGAKPLVVKVPRFDFLPEETAEAVTKEADGLSASPTITQVKTVTLAMLSHVVSAQQLKVLSALSPGHLQFLLENWQGKSGVSLGESDASANSSGSTEAPSTQTSLSGVTADGTSDDDSDGEISET